MIDEWTVCWRAPEEKHSDRAMITLYQLKTNANARLNNMAPSGTLLRGHNVCWNEHFGFSTQLAFLEVREGIWGYYFFIKPYKFYFFPREFLSFIEIHFDFLNFD